MKERPKGYVAIFKGAIRVVCVAGVVLAACFCVRTDAWARANDPDQRFNFRVLSLIENGSSVRVWRNKYDPGDVLPEKMTDYFLRVMRETPYLDSSAIDARIGRAWETVGYVNGDLVIALNLEDLRMVKTDTFGTNHKWDIFLRMTVYDAVTKETIFTSVVHEADSHKTLLYDDYTEYRPLYWPEFEKSPYWSGIRNALREAFSEVVTGYTGYRIVGTIIAKAERVDGSLSVPKKKANSLYHVTIGHNHNLREGDVVAVTRSSSVRTVDPAHPEVHFPQIVARARVFFIKDEDAVVEIIKESRDGPVQLGDVISVPIHGPRKGNW